MDKKVKVSSVSYLNSKPFVYGLRKSDVKNRIELSLDMPSQVALKLEHGQVDIGLVPVAALLGNEKLEIVGSKCIGSHGKVRTVVLASQVPVEDIGTILMDYQSRTSVLLAKILAKFFWKKQIKWENTSSGFEKKLISGNTAAVVIGDRVFEIENKHTYIYDLSNEWGKFTGLPSVFAVWAANKPLGQDFNAAFTGALDFGLANKKNVALEEKDFYPGVDIFAYLTDSIKFELDDAMRESLALFLEMAKKLEPVELT